jgi:hypothetical protein
MADCAETIGIEALREELVFYESKKAEWLLAHEGKFVLIKGSKLLGVFETQEQAYSEGLQQLGNTPFLIKQVMKEEPVQSIPALHFGLIRARS